MGLRAGIGLSLANENIPAAQEGFEDGNKSAISFGANLVAEYHLINSPERISPYVGLGTGFRFIATNSEHTPNQNAERKNLPEEIDGVLYNPGFDFNLSVLVGVEFFLIENLSLATEYRLEGTVHSNPDGEIKSNGNVETTKGSNKLAYFSFLLLADG